MDVAPIGLYLIWQAEKNMSISGCHKDKDNLKPNTNPKTSHTHAHAQAHAHTHTHTHTHTHNHFTALWTLSGTTRMSWYHLLDFLVQNEDNTGRRTNNLDGLPPHPD